MGNPTYFDMDNVSNSTSENFRPVVISGHNQLSLIGDSWLSKIGEWKSTHHEMVDTEKYPSPSQRMIRTLLYIERR